MKYTCFSLFIVCTLFSSQPAKAGNSISALPSEIRNSMEDLAHSILLVLKPKKSVLKENKSRSASAKVYHDHATNIVRKLQRAKSAKSSIPGLPYGVRAGIEDLADTIQNVLSPPPVGDCGTYGHPQPCD